jgi:DNA-binding response OmpR family regulator
MPARILLVVLEPELRAMLRERLEREGYEIAVAADSPAAIELARRGPYDCLVLDGALPYSSGHALLGLLRAGHVDLPMVLLADRVDLVGRVAGPAVGEDDQVAKPVEPDTLVARVAATLRRSRSRRRAALSPIVEEAAEDRGVARTVSCFDLEISPSLREVRRGATRLELTRVDFDLLLALARTPGRAWDREQLGELLFGDEWDPVDRTLDDHVRRIRDTLGPRPDGGSYIEAAGGSGYRVARPDQDS